MNRPRGWLIILVLLTLGLGPAATLLPARIPAAAAQERFPALVVEPVGQNGPYFKVTLDPGEEATLTVALRNSGDDALRVRTFAADAFSLVNGGFGVREADAPVTGAASWLDYRDESFDLDPRRQVNRTFTVTVPAGTAPGQYVAGLVLQTAEPIAVSGTSMLRQIIRTAIAVEITVPGPIEPALEIGDASVIQSTTGLRLHIDIDNTGNVLLKPAGSVRVATQAGETVMESPVTMRSVYAGMPTSIEMPLPTVLDAGDYVVTLDLEDPETGIQASESALPLTVPASAPDTGVEVSIASISVTPTHDPATDEMQFVTVEVVIANTGEVIPTARLTMRVSRDGEPVEDIALNSALVVQQGTTDIVQRYIPLDGWQPGEYDFAVSLDAVNAESGQVTVLDKADAPAVIVSPTERE